MPLAALHQSVDAWGVFRPVTDAAVPDIAPQSFVVPNGDFGNVRLHRIATTGGAPEAFVLGGTDAASFAVDEYGVVRSLFVANSSTKATYSFTATASNAAGTGASAALTCNVVASALVLDPLGLRRTPSNTPGSTDLGGLSYTSGSSFGALTAASITSSTHPGLFTMGSTGSLAVAASPVLTAGQTVKMSVSASKGALNSTGQVWVTIDPAEVAPVVASTVIAVTSGPAGRFAGNVAIQGTYRTTTLVTQSNPGLFSLLGLVGVYTNQNIVTGSGPFWIDITATSYGGTSPVQRVTLQVTQGAGSNNLTLPEDTAGPVAGTPSNTP